MADANFFPLQVRENQFYEIRTLIPDDYHRPCEELRSVKIIKVSKMITVDNVRFIQWTWPSIESLASFFSERQLVLPIFNRVCAVTDYEALRFLLRPIDPVHLCFVTGKLRSTWLHNQGRMILNTAMNLLAEAACIHEVQMTHIRPYRLYEIDSSALKREFRDIIGPVRVAMVSSVGGGIVDVSVPSLWSLNEFLNSEEFEMPYFDRDFAVTHAYARGFLSGVFLPLDQYLPLMRRRDFWIIPGR